MRGMTTIICVLATATFAYSGNLSTVLENLNCTQIKEEEAVPDFVQGPIIAMAIVPESGEMKMDPRGQRVGKISEDVVVLGDDTYGAKEVCSAMDSKGNAVIAIYCIYIAVLVYDAPDKMREDYGCRLILQIVGLDGKHKSYKIITK